MPNRPTISNVDTSRHKKIPRDRREFCYEPVSGVEGGVTWLPGTFEETAQRIARFGGQWRLLTWSQPPALRGERVLAAKHRKVK